VLTDRELSVEFPRPVVDHVLADGAAPTGAEAERLSQLIVGRNFVTAAIS
jgi:hypothetical protein